MWSEGGWTGPDYSVAYAMGPSPTGPFKPMGKILSQDFKIARGAGHHSVVNVPGTDDWYIAYHRRPLDEDSGERRQLAIDRMIRSDEHTSELQSLMRISYAVSCLKKKNIFTYISNT